MDFARASRELSHSARSVLIQAIQSSISNHVLMALLRRTVIQPSHLVFFRDSVTDMCLDGKTLRSRTPETQDWPQAMARLRCEASGSMPPCMKHTYDLVYACIRPLASCGLLTSLRISHCPRLRDEHLVALCDAPSHLRSLSLEFCARLTPAVLSHLGPTLTLMSLSFIGGRSGPSQQPNPLSNPIAHLSTFAHLTCLRLSDQAIGDPAMFTISELTSLIRLSVAGCTITQAGADRLTTLVSLESLDMSWTLAQHPPALERLRRLDMDHCKIGGCWELTFAMYESQVQTPHIRLPYRAATHLTAFLLPHVRTPASLCAGEMAAHLTAVWQPNRNRMRVTLSVA